MPKAIDSLPRFAPENEGAEPILPLIGEMLAPYFRGGRGAPSMALPATPRTKPPAAAAAEMEAAR